MKTLKKNVAVSAGIEWRLLPKLLTEGAFQPLWRKRKDDQVQKSSSKYKY